MKKNILVTGGAGFIGSHLTQALIQRGYHVRVLDNLLYGKLEWIPAEAEFIHGDITDIGTCHTAMKNISVVFHCAAMSRSAPSQDRIAECTNTNVLGTQNILISARDAKVKKIIYSGSSTYYGSQPAPHNEDHTQSEFLNIYALTKHIGEKYCLFFDEAFNLPCVVLRYFNVYGARQPETGPYALVLGIFLQRLKMNLPLEIHGSGEKRRDFIHVKDVVSANIAALESTIRHEILNVGSGISHSIKELAEILSPHHIHVDDRKADAKETLADISKIKKILGWAPTVSLRDGIQELLHSEQDHVIY